MKSYSLYNFLNNYSLIQINATKFKKYEAHSRRRVLPDGTNKTVARVLNHF